jgi:hypothetical protein
MVSRRVKPDVTRSKVRTDDAEEEAKNGLKDHMAGVGGQKKEQLVQV